MTPRSKRGWLPITFLHSDCFYFLASSKVNSAILAAIRFRLSAVSSLSLTRRLRRFNRLRFLPTMCAAFMVFPFWLLHLNGRHTRNRTETRPLSGAQATITSYDVKLLSRNHVVIQRNAVGSRMTYGKSEMLSPALHRLRDRNWGD